MSRGQRSPAISGCKAINGNRRERWRVEGLKEVQSMSMKVFSVLRGMLRQVDDPDIVEQMLLFPRSW